MRRRTTRRDLTGQLLERERVGGFGRSVPFSGDVFPNAFHVSPWMSWSASSGSTPTRSASTSHVGLGALNNSPFENLDYYEFNFEGAAGTWSIKWLHLMSTPCGIVDVTVDGTPVVTVDTYGGSATYNNVSTTTGVAITTSGNHTLRFAIDGKHASSTDYAMAVSAISGVRTGA